jgi:hypothetical protein
VVATRPDGFDPTDRYEVLRATATGLSSSFCSQSELALFLRRGLPGWLDWVVALTAHRCSRKPSGPSPFWQVDAGPDSSSTWKEEIVSLFSTMILHVVEVPV